MSDLEVISLNLTAEYLNIYSELQLFRKFYNLLINNIQRSIYNYRRRKLVFHMEQIIQKIAMIFKEFENIFIVDGMPLKICENARTFDSTICKEEEFLSPSYGYCTSQKVYN